MIQRFLIYLMLVMSLGLLPLMVKAQEFPIAVGSDTTFSAGAVYGGNNGLVAICGDLSSENSITAQLIGTPGTLIGPRISLGATGGIPGARTIFDGTNYFLCWRDFSGSIKGQFINTDGVLVGASFTVATDVQLDIQHLPTMAFDGSNILVAFVKNDGYLYGQRVSPAGSLSGGPIQVSSNLARDMSIAYDGSNYLLVWVEKIPDTDKDIYGQFVSPTGSLVGSNFLIDGGPYNSDNPTSLAFDGSRYLMVYHESPDTLSPFTIMGRFITTSGAIGETITICDGSDIPFNPYVAFDTENYLVTWGQGSSGSMLGRFYNTTGQPVDAPFVIFAPIGNKVPFGGVAFGGGLYLAVATRVDSTFSDGDVYGRFIEPISTGIEEEVSLVPEKTWLSQNYPNPFNPSTVIRWQLTVGGLVKLSVYDVMGKEVTVLVNEKQAAGSYQMEFDGSGLASGIYLYKLQTDGYVETRKMVLMR
jgi:hypothetical protein